MLNWVHQLRRSEPAQSRPAVSVVVVVHNMAREVARTLYSLSADYQRHIDKSEYEVIVVDNGSSPAFDEGILGGLTGNFRLIRIDPAPPSPANAVNRGLAEARGDVVGMMIDGARIATPGLLHFARHGTQLASAAVVAATGWYLGHDLQRRAMLNGYDHAREDALLASIAWPQDGYRLFEIGTLDKSSVFNCLGPIAESNALFLRREVWDRLGGMDERFDEPGGGLVNADVLRRAVELPGAELVFLLGEATFHQLHGGIATNAPNERMIRDWPRWAGQYEAIRGKPYDTPAFQTRPAYIGTLPPAALSRMVHAAVHPFYTENPPLGFGFDQGLWSAQPPQQPADPVIAQLVELAQAEFRAGRYEGAAGVACLARERAPDEPEPQRLLSFTAIWLPWTGPSSPWRADYHLAMGEAFSMLGEAEPARSHYRAALELQPDTVKAHVGIATLRMPGDHYYVWLERLYAALAPETVVEIGVSQGVSLARIKPPTVAIGIDPHATVLAPIQAESHIYPETSDAFFARRGLEPLLNGRPLGVGFIDGLHLYEQALKDFINLEAHCGPRSVILVHDTVPLDEATQSRACDTKFHTGDVWKVVLCLKHYRPDLDVFTIAAPWTGLTVVTGLDRKSRVLADRYDDAVARFIDMPFSDIEGRHDEALNLVANDWSVVEARLKAARVL